MVESLNYRIWIPKKKQVGFMNLAIRKCGGVDGVARALNISSRTVRDWRRAKFLIPLRAIAVFRDRYGLRLPAGMKLRNEFWYVAKGAKKGGLASYKKQNGSIGNPIVRKQKWLEWWEAKGRFRKNEFFRPRPFSRPQKTQELAEFMGIMMGDGGMSHYQTCITLHHIDDKEYSKFVVGLIKKLFNVIPSVYHRPHLSVFEIVVSRVELVNHLHLLGLPIGNKVRQGFDIPDWIRRNPKFQVACVRGLVDTDGSIFNHVYKVGNRQYGYKKLCFASASEPLRNSVFNIMTLNGLTPHLARNKEVRLDSKKDLELYLKIFGSHNPKHLKRCKSVVYSKRELGGVTERSKVAGC